ncbi:MAG: CPBP family intramembrane glutamic endopeptidase [Saprospiraceae bacterium]|nr:CPBP family intramembrane glutamic endopeptidase [Saprospiraceae bacterium]
MVLLTQFGLFLLGGGVSVFIYIALCAAMDWDASLSLHETSAPADRWQVRLQLGLGHLLGFMVAGWLTVWLFYRSITLKRPDWTDYLKIRQTPDPVSILLGILLMTAAIPLILFTLQLNQQLPLPEIFTEAEAQAEIALKGLLQMDNSAELMANLLLIAILPALGEELVFRGVLQQQLMRVVASPLMAIFIASAVFSAVHFQFEGFFPRMLMGFLLGWLFWRSGNFWVPVICHFFNNGIQVVGQYLYHQKVSTIDLEQDIKVPWEFAAVSAFMVWAIMRLIRSRQAGKIVS